MECKVCGKTTDELHIEPINKEKMCLNCLRKKKADGVIKDEREKKLC